VLKVEISQQGGVGGISRRLIIESNLITFLNSKRGDSEAERHSYQLTEDEVEEVRDAVMKVFSDTAVRNRYGYEVMSDCMEINFSLEIDGNKKTINTISDPGDPLPQELHDLYNLYWKLLWKRTSPSPPSQ